MSDNQQTSLSQRLGDFEETQLLSPLNVPSGPAAGSPAPTSALPSLAQSSSASDYPTSNLSLDPTTTTNPDSPNFPGNPTGPTNLNSPRPIIQLSNLRRTYGQGESAVHALDGVSLTVRPGDFLAIMGASGSGKSTMMNILGMLDEPTAGRYLLDGDDVSHLRGRELALIRNRKIGFVFQSFNLIPTMSALANVELPMAYAGVSRKERRERAELALELVGLSSRAKHRPGELSGGQQQRVAVARSLVNSPALILADEPTGNLDSKATEDVLDVFNQVNQSGRTIVLITHEDEVGARASRVVRMRDGRIIGDSDGVAGPLLPKPVSRANSVKQTAETDHTPAVPTSHLRWQQGAEALTTGTGRTNPKEATA